MKTLVKIAAVQVVSADSERLVAGPGEKPLQGLWPILHRVECLLLRSAAPVRRIPVTKIHLQAPSYAGDAPVRDLV